uniref:Uncharacterized protein n=1 Tax=Avena sativa TaxID=4498 RepID=A0ACD5T7D5_AVESA
MSHRNMSWIHQVANLESERGHVQVQPDNFSNGGTGSNLPNPGEQVAFGIPGNTTNVGLRDLQSYYESTSTNIQRQHGQNLYLYGGVDPSSVYPSTMYNPSIPTTSANRYVPHTQSFGLGNPLPSPSYHQVATGTMDESSSSSNFGDATREFIKRKNAVVESGHHFLHGFASSSSSAHMPQNPAHGPWNASLESHGAPNAASADATNRSNSMATHPSVVHYGNYVLPAGHLCQRNAWIAQPANGIADGVPHWEYNNAVRNPPGTIGMPNGSLQDYQAGHSTICHRPLPYFSEIPVHSMQAPALPNPIQMQGPQRHSNVVYGVNPSGIGLTLDPRLAFLSNSGHTTGLPIQGFFSNQVNSGSIRMLPYESAALMDFPRFYEARHAIDEHIDMGLDIDSMSYEELVALEERIGDVSTGLTESYIKENLRVNLYVPGAACIPDKSPVGNDACIICQEEYEAREVVGTLDCRHKYHATCIKQWLMVKNLCPICKTTALSADRSSG